MLACIHHCDVYIGIVRTCINHVMQILTSCDSHMITIDSAHPIIPLQADSLNLAGGTPLHFACQYCPPGKTFTIVKLLQHKAGLLLVNKEGDSAFDLAVKFNRKGIQA